MKILGKDRDLIDTLRIVKNILDKGEFNLVETNLINPVNGLWSVHLKDNDSPFYTNGKGSTKDSAIVSAYCEFLERLISGFFFYDYTFEHIKYNDNFLSSDEVKVSSEDYKDIILNNDLWRFYDPDKDLEFHNLIDSNSLFNDTILTLPFYSFDKTERVLFPLELVKNIYASNGLSVGNSKKEAMVQGLSECIERGVKNKIIKEALPLPDVPKEILIKYKLYHIIEDLEAMGYPVYVKDASLGGKFPVICAILGNKSEGTILTSFGAHPNPVVAIERTLTELFQGRQLDSLDGLTAPVSSIDFVSQDSNIEAHFINSSGYLHVNILKDIGEGSLWNFNPAVNDELLFLKECLENSGYSFFYREFKIDEMWVLHSIVPGLSEIYPVDDLKWDSRNRVSLIREFVRNPFKDVEKIDLILNWLEEGNIQPNDLLLPFLGINSIENSSENSFTFLELEVVLLLCKGALDDVRFIFENQMDESFICKSRIGIWRCIEMILFNKEINPSCLYSPSIINSAEKLLNGEVSEDLLSIFGKGIYAPKIHLDTVKIYNKFRKLVSI